MAPTIDTGGLLLRAVLAERESSRTRPDLSDLESAVTQLDALFKVAWAISDPDTLRLEAEFRSRFMRGAGGEALLLRRFPPSPRVPLPELRSLAMGSPLSLLADVPREFVRGGAAVAALDLLIAHVFSFPLRIQVQREKLRSEMARWKAERTRSELSVIAQQAEALKALSSGNLQARTVDLCDTAEKLREDATQ